MDLIPDSPINRIMSPDTGAPGGPTSLSINSYQPHFPRQTVLPSLLNEEDEPPLGGDISNVNDDEDNEDTAMMSEGECTYMARLKEPPSRRGSNNNNDNNNCNVSKNSLGPLPGTTTINEQTIRPTDGLTVGNYQSIFTSDSPILGTTISSEQNSSVQRFAAHRLVLAAASPVFEAMFYGPMAKYDEQQSSHTCAEFEIPDVHPTVRPLLCVVNLVIDGSEYFVVVVVVILCGGFAVGEWEVQSCWSTIGIRQYTQDHNVAATYAALRVSLICQ